MSLLELLDIGLAQSGSEMGLDEYRGTAAPHAVMRQSAVNDQYIASAGTVRLGLGFCAYSYACWTACQSEGLILCALKIALLKTSQTKIWQVCRSISIGVCSLLVLVDFWTNLLID